MALINNNGTTPSKTLTRDDLARVIADEVGKVRSELLMDKRDKDLKDLDNPNPGRRSKAHGMARDASGGPIRGAFGKSFSDTLATKDVGEMTRLEKARMFARYVQCSVQAREKGGGIDLAYDIAKDAGQETLCKAMQATDFDQGGFMIEPAFAEAVIEELVSRIVYTRDGGVTPIEMPDGGLTTPYEDDGADAQWVGEGTAPNAEGITGGQIRMQPHKLITVVGVSNDFLRARPGVSDQFVLNSILRGMGTKLDNTLLRGLGVSNEPMGLRGLVASANQFDVTSTATITQAVLVREILKLQDLIELQNIDLEQDSPMYFGAPRTKNFLKAQRATDGLLFPGLETKPMDLLGVELRVTSNIPVNLDESGTAADDESELYLVALSHMLLGRTEKMLVDIDPGAAYNNSSGSVVSAFSRDETPIRVIGKWDHAAGQRGNEIAMAQEIDWAL